VLAGPEGTRVRVQRLAMPVTGTESWTVLDDELVTVASAERFLAHLAAIERSPNTVRAYAHSLALWFEWLGLRERAWDAAEVEDVSEFVRWLRAPADNVIVLDVSASRRAESTVNRHLAAVFGFYDFHARAGVELAESLVAWRRVPRGSYKPFLHHVTAGRAIPTRPVKLKAPRRLPGTLSIEEVTTILAACSRLRDRFLMALLAESGMRIGQALGLRHGDFVSRRREVTIVPRTDNANGARAKTSKAVEVGALVRVPQGWDILEVEVLALSDQRRGAPEARALYAETPESVARREREAEARRLTNQVMQHPLKRPDKKQRREIQRFQRQQDKE
jgi:integrase